MTRRLQALTLGVSLAIAAPAIGADDGPRKQDGYRGAWFELGQKSEYGDKYSGGLGTYTTSHVPIAIHAPKVNKTFFVYGGFAPGERNLRSMISYYDHDKGIVPKPTVVHQKDRVNDPHDNPSLAIDDDGRLWVFVAGRANSRPGFIYKSVKPYKIDEFELIDTWDRMAYPQPWFVEGEGFLFLYTMYTKGREEYWRTSPDGRTWSEIHKLVGFGGHYQTSHHHKGRVVTAFNYHPRGNLDRRTNLYLLRTDDMGETWTNAAGEAIKTPLDEPHNPALVHDYEADGQRVYIQDVNLDANGDPVVLYVLSTDHRPGPQDPARSWSTARWDSSEKVWKRNPVTTSTHNYDVGALYIESDGLWRIIGPSEPGPQHWGTGGEMAMWTSDDQGASWTKVRQLTAESSRNHAYARRPINAHDDFYALWADGDADKLSESHLYFCNKAGDVFRLPPDMEEDYARPEKR